MDCSLRLAGVGVLCALCFERPLRLLLDSRDGERGGASEGRLSGALPEFKPGGVPVAAGGPTDQGDAGCGLDSAVEWKLREAGSEAGESDRKRRERYVGAGAVPFWRFCVLRSVLGGGVGAGTGGVVRGA